MEPSRSPETPAEGIVTDSVLSVPVESIAFDVLLENFELGSRWAQRELWHRYKYVVSQALTTFQLNSSQDCQAETLDGLELDDIEQETCRVLLSRRRHGSLEPCQGSEDTFVRYLHALSVSVICRVLERETKELRVARQLSGQLQSKQSCRPVDEALAEREDLKNRFQHVLATLPPRRNRGRDLFIFTLVFWDGLDFDAVADLLPGKMAHHAVVKAYQRMRKEIERRLQETMSD